MVAATESDACGVIVCSSDTEGCGDSDEKGDRDPVVDRLVVLELVKDWLGLEE